MRSVRVPAIGFAAVMLFVASCTNPPARIMTEDEGDLVGDSAAGSAAYSRLISESVDKLLVGHSAAAGGLEPLKVAVLDVENRGIEELLDWQEQIYDLIATAVNQSGRYRTISQRFVHAALRENRLRPDELFLPAKRRLFMQTLETNANPVDVLLFPTLTTGTTRASGQKQRDYSLTLELVDVERGYDERVSTKLRKAYNR